MVGSMVVRKRIRSVLIPLVLYAALAGIVGYFVHSARIGNRGLEAKQALKIQIYHLNQEVEAARADHAEWDRRVALLRADGIDRDLLEERARVILGRVHRHDLVIVTP
jgi:cell division protein FtsB